jgi:hypothetical protein
MRNGDTQYEKREKENERRKKKRKKILRLDKRTQTAYSHFILIGHLA